MGKKFVKQKCVKNQLYQKPCKNIPNSKLLYKKNPLGGGVIQYFALKISYTITFPMKILLYNNLSSEKNCYTKKIRKENVLYEDF